MIQVHLEVSIGKRLTRLSPSTLLAYIYAQFVLLGAENIRRPVKFVLVLDVSGSMSFSIDLLKDAAKTVVGLMREQDYLSVVVYGDRGASVFNLTKATTIEQKTQLFSYIDQIGCGQIGDLDIGGGTDIAAGLNVAIDQLEAVTIQESIEQILLLTDGQDYSTVAILKQADRAKARGASIAPFGLETGWNQDLLNNIAIHSGYPFPAEYIASAEDMGAAFTAQFRTIQAVILKNAVLRLKITGGVHFTRVTQAEPQIQPQDIDPSGRELVISVGDVPRGIPLSYLFEIKIEPGRKPGLFRIAEAILEYDAPGVGRDRIQQNLMMTFILPDAQESEPSANVMNIVEKVIAARLSTSVIDEYRQTGKSTKRLAANVTAVLDLETQRTLAEIQGGQVVDQAKLLKATQTTRRLTQRLD